MRRYRVQKFVMANSAVEAIEKSKELPVQDVFVDEPAHLEPRVDAIWF